MIENKTILEQAIEVQKHKYCKKLNGLHEKLKKLLEGQNYAVANIKTRQGQIGEKRKEVNELMVKLKLISEDDLEKLNETPDDTVSELPEHIEIDNVKEISKYEQELCFMIH